MSIQDYRGHSTQPTAALSLTPSRLEAIAKETDFIKRKTPGFSASSFLLSLLKAVSGGKGSLTQIALSLGAQNTKTLSKQGLSYHFKEEGIAFMDACLNEVSTSGSHSLPPTFSTDLITRVLLQDATQLRLHPSNSEHFKGMRNQAKWTSCVKLDTLSDLQTDEIVTILLSEGKEQDRVNGHELFKHLKGGDLVLRDMGYFDVSAFARIDDAGAYWISRLTAMANVRISPHLSLEEVLKNTRKDKVDLAVEVSSKHYRCRLVAIRLPEEVANQRRAKSHAHRKKMGNKARPQSLQREGWEIYLTNLKSEVLEAPELVRFYKQRWGIEIKFRALKGSAHIRELLSCRANKTHLLILIKAIMIYAHLAGKAQRYFIGKLGRAARLSSEKISRWLGVGLLNMASIDSPIIYDPRALSLDKRKRLSMKDRMPCLF